MTLVCRSGDAAAERAAGGAGPDGGERRAGQGQLRHAELQPGDPHLLGLHAISTLLHRLAIPPRLTPCVRCVRNVQFRNLYITGAFNAVEMECGPSINGGDSGCWYNAFYTVRAQPRLHRSGPSAAIW